MKAHDWVSVVEQPETVGGETHDQPEGQVSPGETEDEEEEEKKKKGGEEQGEEKSKEEMKGGEEEKKEKDPGSVEVRSAQQHYVTQHSKSNLIYPYSCCHGLI